MLVILVGIVLVLKLYWNCCFGCVYCIDIGIMTPIFLVHISSSFVKIRLHTENQLPTLPGSALKVPCGVHYGYKVRYTTAIRWLPTHY